MLQAKAKAVRAGPEKACLESGNISWGAACPGGCSSLIRHPECALTWDTHALAGTRRALKALLLIWVGRLISFLERGMASAGQLGGPVLVHMQTKPCHNLQR